jgi:ADP-dependent NAD(P)H-hydrate dehydratase
MTAVITLDARLLATKPLPQPAEGSKDLRGSVAIVGGSREVPGAALLAALGAMRSGAGKLKIATAESCATALGVATPEALVLGLRETEAGGVACAAIRSVVDRVCMADAILVGPGMVEEPECDDLLAMLLAHRTRAVFVVDAGALPKIMERKALLQARRNEVVLTPHAGEMATLLGVSREEVEAEPLNAAQTVSDTLGAVVIVKGSDSFIVSPSGSWCYRGGAVGLATSGSGDVLAGIITGLAGRGASATDAALWGVFLHGEAGTQLSKTVGPLGFLAREIPGCIPGLLAQVSAGRKRLRVTRRPGK